jgi:hypothetical protein
MICYLPPHALKRRESIKKFLRRRGPKRRRLHATGGAQEILCVRVLKYFFKGQCHEIFCFRGFLASSSSKLLKITLGSF